MSKNKNDWPTAFMVIVLVIGFSTIMVSLVMSESKGANGNDIQIVKKILSQRKWEIENGVDPSKAIGDEAISTIIRGIEKEN